MRMWQLAIMSLAGFVWRTSRYDCITPNRWAKAISQIKSFGLYTLFYFLDGIKFEALGRSNHAAVVSFPYVIWILSFLFPYWNRLESYISRVILLCWHRREPSSQLLVCRSALATDPPPSVEELYITEPIYQIEETEVSYTKVVVVSAMQEWPCLAEGGDELHYLSVLNKQVCTGCL